jgi:hypothetical protein
VLGTTTAERRGGRVQDRRSADSIEGRAARLLTMTLTTRMVWLMKRLETFATLPLAWLRGVAVVVGQESLLDGLARGQRCVAEHMRRWCAVDLVRMTVMVEKLSILCQLGVLTGAGIVMSALVPFAWNSNMDRRMWRMRWAYANSRAAMEHLGSQRMMASRRLLLRPIQSPRRWRY